MNKQFLSQNVGFYLRSSIKYSYSLSFFLDKIRRQSYQEPEPSLASQSGWSGSPGTDTVQRVHSREHSLWARERLASGN